MDANEARAALEQIAQTRASVAERSKAPTGYYSLIGVLQVLFLISILVKTPWSFVLLVPGIVILGVAVGWYRSSVGTWGGASAKGEGAWILWFMIAVTILAFCLVLALGTLPVGVICGVVVFVTYATLGPQWDRAYRRQVAQP